MARDFLALLGLVFLILLIASLLLVVGYYYDALGLVNVPDVVPTTLAKYLGPRQTTVSAIDVGTAEWTNPLALLPTATWAPSETPQPTPTPIRPLDPAEYRTEVILHLKDFAQALEGWLDANRRLGKDNALLDDAAWRGEMTSLLDQIAASGQALAEVGPAPEEYEGIARLLARVGAGAEALRADYARAMETRQSEDFQKAGGDFERIKAYLAEAVQAMLAQGWAIE